MAFFRRRKNKKSIMALLLIVVFAVGGFFFFHNLKKAAAEWFDSNWFYRQAITITVTSSASDLANLDTWFSMNTSSLITGNKLQSGCQDLRFTNTNGKQLPYFIDSGCNTTTTKIWVRIDLVPKNSTTYTLYAYYGNPSASSGSDSNKFNLYNGLAGYWNMNESAGAGSTLADFSTNNATGTAKLWGGGNTATDSAHVAGKYGNGFSFDGGDDYIDAGNNSAFNFTSQDFSIAMWIKPDTVSTEKILFSKGLYQTDGYYLYQTATAGLSLKTNQSGVAQTSTTSNGSISSGQWQHVVVTRAGSTVTIYVNGMDTTSTHATHINPTTSARTAKIGMYDSLNYLGYDGTMDDVRVYNRALSVGEVSQLYSDNTSSILTAVYGQAVPSVSFATEEKGPGPVAYFKFDEGQGTTAYDSSSNRKNGTLGNFSSSNPTWVTEDQCISGKCLKFNGTATTGGYVLAPSIPSVASASALTVSAWINPKTMHADYESVATDSWTKFYLGFDTNSKNVYFSVRNTSLAQVFSGEYTLPNADQWYFLTGVADEATGVRLYVNGVLVANNTPGAFTINKLTDVIWIGSNGSTSAQDYFNGYIDEVNIYPYARTLDQIKADYNAGKSGAGGTAKSANFGAKTQDWVSNGLVGYWKMDEATGSGAILADSSGNGNDGTAKLYGGGNTATDSAHLAGKYGNGFRFDGGDDYINAGTGASLNNLTAATWTAWVKLNNQNTQWFVYKSDGDSSQGWLMGIDGGSGLIAKVVNGCADLDRYTSIPAAGTWFHMVATWSGGQSENSIHIYINGSEVNYIGGEDGTCNHDSDSSQPVYIGRGTAGGATTYSNSTIDDVRIYNRALSPKEVSDLYNWAPGPVGWWKMDDGVSGNAKTLIDSSGYGNNATAYYGANAAGMNCKVIGRSSGGCLFDGVDDYAEAANSSSLNLVYGVTIEAWVKLRNAANSGRGDMQFIFNKTNNGAFRDGYDMYFSDSTQELVFEILNHNTWIGQSTNKTDWQPNVWYHIAGTYQYQPTGTNNLKIYVNGVLDAQFSYNNATIGTNSEVATIGDAYGSAHWYNTAGAIDDLRIYNYARTQKQIAEDMNSGHPAVGSPIGSYAGYWKFDEGYGTTTYDQSINHNDGTISGATWNNNGKFGKALNFNGSSSYVDVGHNASLEMGTHDISISAWIKTSSASDQAIIYKGGGDLTEEGYFFFYYPTNGDLRFYLSDGATRIYPNSDDNLNINDGNWHHVVVSVNRSGSVIFYKDNRNVGSFDISSSFVGTDITNSGVNLNIGWVSGMVFNGLIDEVKIYPFAMTADEIKTEYNHGKSIVMGSVSDTSGLAGGSVASNSASAAYCVPGDTASCSSPVAEWKMDENSGDSIYDTSGNGNTGSLGAGTASYKPTWQSAPCKFGSCLKFDGTNDYVDPGTGSSLNITSAITIEAWINPLAWKGNNVGYNEMEIYNRGVNSGANKGLWLETENDGTLIFGLGNGTTYYELISALHYSLNVFTHVVGTWDGTTMKIYINGIQDTNTHNIASPISYNSTNARIGDAEWDLLNRAFNGYIDDVRIFNYARTPAQVAWDYNRGKPVGYWRFDECQGTTTYDSSGNGNNGTITIGATAPQTTAGTCITPTDGTGAWYNGRSGKYNSAMSFDGADDYVDVGNPTNLNFGTGSLTVEAWVNRQAGTAAQYGGIFKGNGDGNTQAGWNLRINNYDEGIGFTGGDGSGNVFNVTVWPLDTTYNVWMHIVGVLDRTAGKAYLYKNGVLIGTDSTILSTSTTSADSLTFAKDWSSSHILLGSLDDVKIYNYPLTPAQIKLDYNQGAAVRFGPITGRP
jgi:hypothetical protein